MKTHQNQCSVRLLAIVLLVAILIGSMGVLPLSALPVPDLSAEEWGDPNGDGVWEIDSVDDLFAFAAACADDSNGLDCFNSQTVRLMCNVNLNPGWDAATRTAPAGGRVWTPVSRFKGTFDGQGYTISGLYLNGAGNQGFIWRGDGCIIRDLRIENSYIWSAGDYSGGVVASVSNNRCVFENIHSNVVIETETPETGYSQVAGGICGVLYGADAEFTDCSFSGTVSGGVMVGGILGTSNEYKATLRRCVNYGTVRTQRGDSVGTEAGGMIGRIAADAELIACANLGAISTGNNQWSGGLAYLDRKTITKNNSETNTPTTVAAVRFTDCYTSDAAVLKHGIGLHGSRNRFDVTVSYTGGETDRLTFADKTTTWDNAKGVIQTVTTLPVLATKPGMEQLVLPLEQDGAGVIHLSDADDWFDFAAYAAAYGYYEGLTVRMNGDVDLNPGWDAATKSAPARVWVPIVEFRGVLDGDGYTLSGVYVNQESSGSALLVKLVGATVQNFRMTNSYILSTSKNYIGSIASSVSGEEPSLFRNLYSEAIVEGRKTDGTAIDCIGGILGGCYYGVAEMQSVVFNGTVSGSAGVGGIVGNVNSLATDENSPSSELTLSDCANYGEILATSNHNGGLVGLNRGHLTLNRCYNARTVPSTDGFSGSLVYLECNSRTEQARISIADTYYLTGTNANALIAWHNYYALTVTYDGVQTGSAAMDSNTSTTTNHSSLIRSLTETTELMDLPALIGWTMTEGLAVPAGVAEMLRPTLAETAFVQEPTAPAGDSTRLRVVSTVDLGGKTLEEYTEVGFYLRVVREDGKAVSGRIAGSTVYTSLLADTDRGMESVTAQQLGADYLCALTVTNIPADGTYRIYLRAFLADAAGNECLDSGCCLTVTDGVLVE